MYSRVRRKTSMPSFCELQGIANTRHHPLYDGRVVDSPFSDRTHATLHRDVYLAGRHARCSTTYDLHNQAGP